MDMLPVEISGASGTLRVGEDEIVVLTSSTETDGDLFAVQLRMPPGGGPPVMHRHAPSEVYRVLQGEFTFYVTGTDGTTRRRVAGPGETVALSGGTPHTIRNESDADAVAFCVHAPGTAMEGFSRAAAAIAATGRPSMDDVLRIAQQNGIELLGPVPSSTGRQPGGSTID